MKIQDLGERAIIRELILPLLSVKYGNVLLDDCAIVNLGDVTLLLSVDQGPRRTFLELLDVGSPRDVGHFHVTVNASDIAAMGGRPIGMLLVLAMEGDEEVEDLEAFLEGIRDGMDEYSLELLGGDTKQARVRATSITVIGQAINGSPLQRRGACVGDLVYITPGEIGYCLSSYVHAAREKSVTNRRSVVRPRAEIGFGQALAESRVATSCIDMSDGTLASAEQLGQMNGANLLLDPALIPVAKSPCLDRMLAWKNLVLNVGGDFGLMFTVSKKDAGIAESLGGLAIGEVVPGKGGLYTSLLYQQGIHVHPWEQFKTVEDTSNEILSFV